MVELIVNGKSLDLLKKGNNIKYTRQIADVFDIASVSSSYTNTFLVPKTANNTQIFEHLGIVGDQSSIPYTKTQVTVRDNGFDVITMGWLNVSETAESYKCSVIDGMVDFFKAIENKTLGVDLDLSNFQHNKDIQTVVDSFDNEYYNYLVADYGGKNMIVSFFPTKRSISIDYLVPSFSVKKLFELIMQTFGYTYESDAMDAFLEGLYITYPTPPTFEASEDDVIAELKKNYYKETNLQYVGDKMLALQHQVWDETDVSEGSLEFNGGFVVLETSGYNISLSIEAYLKYYQFNATRYVGLIGEIKKNGTPILSLRTDPYEEKQAETNIFLQAGDVLKYTLYYPLDELNFANGGIALRADSFNHLDTVLEISKINQGDVTPNNAFKDFKVKDFFKEMLYRTGLTPIADNLNKKITFLPISERLDVDNSIDWSEKYVRRVNERYIKNTYAQRNIFKMKYNDGAENKNDGVILVNNANIADEKTLVQSVFYSPSDGTTEFTGTEDNTVSTAILPMYQKELTTDENEQVITNYKELDNRFYLLRKNTVTDSEWRFKSQIIDGEQIVDRIHFATTERTLLGQLVNENFSEYERIFDNFREHPIELALGLEDIINLDLTRPYYFNQESSYYILNRLPYQDGETTTGEFVKINR